MRVWSVPIVASGAAGSSARTDASVSDSTAASTTSPSDLRADPGGTLYDFAHATCHELALDASTRARLWLPVLLLAPLLGATLASIPITVMDGISTTLGWSTASEGWIWERPFDVFGAVALFVLLFFTALSAVLLLPLFKNRALQRCVRAELSVADSTRLRLVPAEVWDGFVASLEPRAG